jgi:hypothetical protein
MQGRKNFRAQFNQLRQRALVLVQIQIINVFFRKTTAFVSLSPIYENSYATNYNQEPGYERSPPVRR